jgi:hypothetical protein
MPKWAKFIIAVLMLPACAGAGAALLKVIRSSGNADSIWVALFAGAACWLVVFLLLPKPMWIYVLGHELTHALWVWLFGGRVKKFKASASGGHVVVTRTNFLIALAPYFFPLYAALVVAIFVLGHHVWDLQRHAVWFHLLLGATYAFHVTLTAHVLGNRQSDITEQGYLFSSVVIFLGNIGVLLTGIPLLAAGVDLQTALGWWMESTGDILRQMVRLLPGGGRA